MTHGYQIRDIDNIKVQSLDYMSLLYDRNSGITHIIAEPAPQIIEALGDKLLTAFQVEQYLKKIYDIESADEQNGECLEDIITARLDELVDLGLALKSPLIVKPIIAPSTNRAQINPKPAEANLPDETYSPSAGNDGQAAPKCDPS